MKTVESSLELDLVERLRGGETAAFGRLMDRYAPRVYRVAHGITRNEADAEEVVQDVFFNLSRRIDTFEGRAALGTWIHRIATNAALSKRRRNRSERMIGLEDHLASRQANGHRGGGSAPALAGWSPTPEEELLSLETRTILKGAIDALPDRSRSILFLRHMEGLSNEEVAKALGESIASVKSQLHRARVALRERLRRYFWIKPRN